MTARAKNIGIRAWTPRARRLGVGAAIAIFVIGVLYVGVIGTWLLVEAVPQEPIGDPYLAVMEALTIVSAFAIVGFVVALQSFAADTHRLPALAALVSGCLGAALTITVHFVQLTAVRQLWQAGELADYRLVWPSAIFAVEYVAWDVFVGGMMIAAGLSLSGHTGGRPARRALLVGGVLCVVGAAGPISGWMALQNVSVLGYAVVLPIAAALSARMFYRTDPAVP